MTKAHTLLLAPVLALMVIGGAGCNKHEVIGHGDNNGNGRTPGQDDPARPQETFELRENKAWNIGYAGRGDLTESDGSVIRVDDILVQGTGDTPYLVSVISRDNYATYGGDLEAFLKDELAYNSDYVYTSSPMTIHFDPFRHGTWYGFVIGLTTEKKLTGEYAWAKFEVAEEEPTADYLAWLGKWSIGSGRVSYDITISQQEANYVYRIDGWETGSSIDPDTGTVMDQEYLETFFDAPTRRMYFTSQYIGSYKDDYLGDVDYFFLGQIDYDGILAEQGLYIITGEGLDLAEARMTQDGTAATVLPCSVTTVIDDKEEFEAPFYNMQYFCDNGKQWYVYNENVPTLPLAMVRKSGGPAAAPALTLRGSATKAVEVSTMPSRGKVHRPKAERQKATAVKVK